MPTGFKVRVRLPAGKKYFSLVHSENIGSGNHKLCYPMVIRGYFPGVKLPGSEADGS
jgi:hypothetical protein